MELIRSYCSIDFGLPRNSGRVGSCITRFEACSAFTHVTACMLAKSPYATLYTRGFGGFVASTAAPIATGWSEPVPGRVYLPLWTSAFSRRTRVRDYTGKRTKRWPTSHNEPSDSE